MASKIKVEPSGNGKGTCASMSIIDGSRKCPNVTNNEDDQKYLLAWKRDNAWTAALI
jgi:hypothetical protein